MKEVGNVSIPLRPRGLLMRVRGRINGSNVVILNDSGADCSVISESLAQSLGCTIKSLPKPMNVHNPNGTPFSVQGEVQGTIFFNNGVNKLPFRAIVLKELQGDLIVGDDFLRANNAILEYGRNTVCYGNFEVPCLSQVSYADRSYKTTDGVAVTVGSDLLLRRGKVAQILAKVVLPAGFKYGQYAWRFEPLEMLASIGDGILSCDSIVTLVDAGTVAAIVLANPRGPKDVVIPEGTVIGRLRILRGSGWSGSIPVLEELSLVQNINASEAPVMQGELPEPPSLKECDEDAFAKQLPKILEELPKEVSDGDQAQLVAVLTKFRHILCATKLGETNVFEFDMDMAGCREIDLKVIF